MNKLFTHPSRNSLRGVLGFGIIALVLSCTACSSAGVTKAVLDQACNDSYQLTIDTINSKIANNVANGNDQVSSKVHDEEATVTAEWQDIAKKDSKYTLIYQMFQTQDANGTVTDAQSKLFFEVCPLK